MKTIIKSSQFRIMPWKNGLGVTSEISISPEGADFTKGDFHWRLSSAKVSAKNNFSNFPGYDRLLTVLGGDGLQLNDRKLLPLEIYKFQGEEKIECSLLAGPVEDYGLIYDRKKFRCEMKVMTVEQKTELKAHGGVHFLRPLSSHLKIDNETLENSDVFRIDGADHCQIDSREFPLRILMVSIYVQDLRSEKSPETI